MLDPEQVTLGTFSDGYPAVLTHDDRRRHLYLIGKTGSGKSNLLFNLMQADLQRGAGFALLDPHADLAERVADSIPPELTNRVIYVDPADIDHPIGLNLLNNVPPDQRPLVAAHVTEAFQHIWGMTTEAAPRATYILTHALRLLLDAPGSTLLGLPRLLTNDEYRHRLLAHTRDPIVRGFWTEEFPSWPAHERQTALMPVQNKVGALLQPYAIRYALGQTKSTINIREVMDRGQILLVNLSKRRLGLGPAHLIGALLTTAFAQAAEARADVPEDERRDFTLYADEFQHFATDSFATILSEARKWHLSLVLSHQFLGQLPDLLRQAVVGNTGSIVVFRVGAEDAQLLADELGIPNKATLGETANFSAWVKLMRNGIPTDPRPITTEKQYPLCAGRFEAVLRHSQARYARPRKVVEEKLRRFLENKPRTAAAHFTPKKPHYLEDIRNTLTALNDKINAQQAAQQARSLFP